MNKLQLNKETLRRLGTETLANLVTGMYTDPGTPTDTCPSEGCANTLDPTCVLTSNCTIKTTSMRTTGP